MRASYPIVEKNIEGRYYVDTSCEYCERCVNSAPSNFGHDEERGVAYIKKQPSSQEEHERVLYATRDCPNISIGDKLHRHESAIDDAGLGHGTTPKSLFGALAKTIASWARRV